MAAVECSKAAGLHKELMDSSHAHFCYSALRAQRLSETLAELQLLCGAHAEVMRAVPSRPEWTFPFSNPPSSGLTFGAVSPTAQFCRPYGNGLPHTNQSRRPRIPSYQGVPARCTAPDLLILKSVVDFDDFRRFEQSAAGECDPRPRVASHLPWLRFLLALPVPSIYTHRPVRLPLSVRAGIHPMSSKG